MNEATLSGLEPAAITSLGSMEEKKERSSVKAGLVLGGGLPSIPSELLRRVKENSYVELSEFLPERIQESFLFPDGKKKKIPSIDRLSDWVLAFCTFSQALLASNPGVSAADLITFIGTVARLARDHPGSAWVSYEHAIRAKAVADPSIQWNRLDQEAWALATVSSGRSSGSTVQVLPQKRKQAGNCFKWNEGVCSFRNCKYTHACSVCQSPLHKESACPSNPSKQKKAS